MCCIVFPNDWHWWLKWAVYATDPDVFCWRRQFLLWKFVARNHLSEYCVAVHGKHVSNLTSLQPASILNLKETPPEMHKTVFMSVAPLYDCWWSIAGLIADSHLALNGCVFRPCKLFQRVPVCNISSTVSTEHCLHLHHLESICVDFFPWCHWVCLSVSHKNRLNKIDSWLRVLFGELSSPF